ncbi:MAG: DUF6515 family protein, partial [Algoriella sp.]
MRKIRFTLLGVAFTAMMAVGVNAQERGNRRGSEGNSRETTRVQTNNGRSEVSRNDNRVDNNRTDRISRDTNRSDVNRTTRPSTNNDRISRDNTAVVGSRPTSNRDWNNGNKNNDNRRSDRDYHNNPIRMSNSSYNRNYRPVSNFDVNRYNKYSYNNYNFYGNNGMYYRPYNNGYVRYMPSIGFRINILPVGFVTINTGNRNPYYFYEGVY